MPSVPDKPRKGWLSLRPYLDKNLSPMLENVTVHQLDCLIEGIFLGDGTKRNPRAKRITSINRIFFDRLQSLCVRRGKTAVLAERKTRTSVGNPVYDLHISQVAEAGIPPSTGPRNRLKPDEKPAVETRVWCVENELHTIVVRRNGKVAVIGNSQCEDRLHRIGMDTTRESLLAYYLVNDTGIDETMQEALGVKVGQFVGIMGDKAPGEDDEMMNQRAAERHMDGVIEQLKARGKRGG